MVEDKKRSFGGLVAFGFILVLGILYLIRDQENIQKVLEVKLYQIFWLSILIIGSYFLNAYRFNLLLRGFNIQMNLGEWFGLSMMNTLGNILFYKGGSAGIAWFLKKKYRFPYIYFLSMWGGSSLIVLLVVSLVGQLSLIIIWTLFDKFNQWLFLLFLGLFWAILLLAFLFPCGFSSDKNRFFNFLVQILSSWNDIRQNKKLVLSIAVIDLFGLMLFSLRLYYCYIFINSPISFWYCNLMSVFISISALVNLTPGDLGIREFVVGLTSQILGTGFKIGLVAAALDRTVGLFWIFLLGGVSGKILMSRLKRDLSPSCPSNILS